MSDQPALAEFLEARLAEDWEAATASITTVGDTWEASGSVVEIEGDTKGRSVFEWTVCFDEGAPSEAQADHIARHDPARVLREVAAKRAILAAHANDHRHNSHDCIRTAWYERESYCWVIRELAAVYSDHSDYRPEWDPEAWPAWVPLAPDPAAPD